MRMDLSHSGWSDIFFLGMDYPGRGARPQHIDRPERARLGRSPSAGGGVVSGYRPTGVAVGECRSEEQRRNEHGRGSVRFRARLPGSAQGGCDCLRDRAARNGGRHPATGRPPGPPDRAARPRHRNRQQGERHSARIAPGGLDQLVGFAHCRLHARDEPDSRSNGRAGRAGPAPGSGAGNSRRVAGRFGWRLAGFGRCVAGDQTDPWSAGAGGRSGIRREPRAPAARSSHLRLPGRAAGDPAPIAGKPRARAWRHGAGRGPHTRNGDREIPAALGERMAGEGRSLPRIR